MTRGVAGFMTLALVVAMPAAADTIRFDGYTYENVYVTKGPNLYYVSVPSTGDIINVPQAGRVEVLHSSDADRAALRTEWRRNRERAGMIPEQLRRNPRELTASPAPQHSVRPEQPAAADSPVEQTYAHPSEEALDLTGEWVFTYTLTANAGAPIKVHYDYGDGTALRKMVVATPRPPGGPEPVRNTYVVMSQEGQPITIRDEWSSGEVRELTSVEVIPPSLDQGQADGSPLAKRSYIETREGKDLVLYAEWRAGELSKVELAESESPVVLRE